MIHNIKNIITNFTIRTEEKKGQHFIIIPIVALVEGVHNGSGGAGFYPSAEIDRTAQNWNGVPLTVNHPVDNSGSPITANNPETLRKYSIGTFENVRYEGGKLKGEGWIDMNRLELISPETLEIIRLGNRLEVSTGLFTNSDGMPGKWEGEVFEETLSDFIPDHLALLPNSEGACNFDAGCGVRMNTKKECKNCKLNINKEGGEANVKDKKLSVMEFEEARVTLNGMGFWVNEISHSKVREQLFKLVNDMDKPGSMHFLREVFDKHFIFEKVTENESKLFKISYKINREDEVSVKGDPTEVKEKIEFITVNEEGSMKRKEQVDTLIANEKLAFIEDDREMLAQMGDESFDRLFTVNACDCDEKVKDELIKANEKVIALTDTNKKLEETLKVNAESKKEKDDKPADFETLLANAKPEDREAWNGMVAEKKQRKDNAISVILGAEGNKFTEEKLQNMPFDTLENIISMSPVKANYSGNGSKVQKVKVKNMEERQEDGSGVPLMPQARWNQDGSPDFSHLNKD